MEKTKELNASELNTWFNNFWYTEIDNREYMIQKNNTIYSIDSNSVKEVIKRFSVEDKRKVQQRLCKIDKSKIHQTLILIAKAYIKSRK